MDHSGKIRTFCENIKYLRKKHGLSKKEMAKKLGIGVASMSVLESGRFPPRFGVNTIYYIYENFGILPSQIFNEDLNSACCDTN